MPDAPLVSVVLPTYNGGAYIAETLRGVLEQTHPAVEIIVVDDGSTDETVSIVRASAPRARLLQQPNARVSAARNAGLRVAQGAFICFLDQDDVWHPLHLSAQLRCFADQTGAAVVVSPYLHWYPDGCGRYPSGFNCWPQRPGGAAPLIDPEFSGWVYHQFLLDCWSLTSGTLLRREAMVQSGGFDEGLPFSEDWDLWLRLSRELEFVKNRWPPVLYRQHASQGTRTLRPVDWRCELLLRNVEAHGLSSRDGRSVAKGDFDRTVSRYQTEFGCQHLAQGDTRVGAHSLSAALHRDPLAWPHITKSAVGALFRRFQSRRRSAVGSVHTTGM